MVCGGFVWSVFVCYVIRYILSSFAIILLRTRELVALLCLSGDSYQSVSLSRDAACWSVVWGCCIS